MHGYVCMMQHLSILNSFYHLNDLEGILIFSYSMALEHYTWLATTICFLHQHLDMLTSAVDVGVFWFKCTLIG